MPADPAPAGGTPLSALGEAGVLARILPLAPRGSATLLGPGDDAALVAAPDGRVVATADVLVEGRDFRFDLSTGEDVGWKAAAQNLADVAAMGASPTGLLVSVAAPPHLRVEWLEALVRGLAACCEGTGAGLVGGDLSSADAVVVAVTALGDLAGREPVLRSGARPGDVLAHAGVLGHSAAGLDLLLAGLGDATGDVLGDAATAVSAHRRPRPPLAAGVAAATGGASAMLDVSDGLVRDARRIAAASGVHLDLDRPLSDGYDAVLHAAASALGVRGERARWERFHRWVLTGGEDHGLLATFPQDAVLPEGFTRVGRVLPVRPHGPAVSQGEDDLADLRGGWDHFA